MAIHQCPKCELKFAYKTELDDHCWHDHPTFQHEYPASPPPAPPVEEQPAAPAPMHVRPRLGDSLTRWLAPKHRPAHSSLELPQEDTPQEDTPQEDTPHH